MSRSARGFTITELLASLAAMGAFGAAFTSVSMRVNEEQKAAAGREADLDGLRRAARLLEADVRAGLCPTTAGWRLDGDRLLRGAEVVARSVSAFEAHCRGELWRLRIAVRPRVREGPRRDGVLEWFVRARATSPTEAGR